MASPNRCQQPLGITSTSVTQSFRNGLLDTGLCLAYKLDRHEGKVDHGRDSMSVQPLHDDGDRNPRTMEEARTFVKYVESLFMPWNIDALVDGFTDDCVVRFGTVPEFRGRDALRSLFIARRAKQKGLSAKETISHTDE
jgi:hypothetical protein